MPWMSNRREGLAKELEETASAMQEALGTMRLYSQEQAHTAKSLTELASAVQAIKGVLIEGTNGTPSLTTRVLLLEKLAVVADARMHAARSWWLSLLSTLLAILIVAVVTAFLTMYYGVVRVPSKPTTRLEFLTAGAYADGQPSASAQYGNPACTPGVQRACWAGDSCS